MGYTLQLLEVRAIMEEDTETGDRDKQVGGEEAGDRGLQEPLLHSCRCEENRPGVVAWIDKADIVGADVVGGHKGLCICGGCRQGGDV